jgi:hypothetical protein
MDTPESTLITDESGKRVWVTADGNCWQYPDFAEHCASMACHALGLNLPEFDRHLKRSNLFERATLLEWRANLVEAFSEGLRRETKAWVMLMRTHLHLGAQNRQLLDDLWRINEDRSKGGKAGRRLPEHPVLLQAFEQALAHQKTVGQRSSKAAAYVAVGERFSATPEAVRQAFRRAKISTPP